MWASVEALCGNYNRAGVRWPQLIENRKKFQGNYERVDYGGGGLEIYYGNGSTV